MTRSRRACGRLPRPTRDQCRLIELPNASVEGRPILALALGEDCGAARRTAIYVGGVHAREWIPPDALLYLSADLLEARATGVGLTYGAARIEAEEVRRIFAGLQLVVLPCANPDGRVYSQEVDPDWRKNRGGGADGGCVGVDMNRNFDVAWDFRRTFAPDSVSASDDPCHKYVYVGPAAASEPETRNIVWLLDQYPRDRMVHRHPRRRAGGVLQLGARRAAERRPGAELPQRRASTASAASPANAAYREFIDPADAAELRRLSDLMADEIARSAATTTRSRPPSRSTRPPGPATTTPTAGIAPTRRFRRCWASPSSAATTSSRNGPRPSR